MKKNNDGTNRKMPIIERGFLHKTIITITVTAIISSVCFKYILIPGLVPSSSMEPTLKVGDWGFANGLAYICNRPDRGDIIVFYNDESDCLLIKRVIGLPGDTVSIYDGHVYINDALLDEDYIAESVDTYSPINDFYVPEDHYFVLGDNRTSSSDSRYWENPYISIRSIKGKYLIKLFNFNRNN